MPLGSTEATEDPRRLKMTVFFVSNILIWKPTKIQSLSTKNRKVLNLQLFVCYVFILLELHTHTCSKCHKGQVSENVKKKQQLTKWSKTSLIIVPLWIGKVPTVRGNGVVAVCLFGSLFVCLFYGFNVSFITN